MTAAGSSRALLLAWVGTIVAYVVWLLLVLTVVDGGLRRLVTALFSSPVVQDRAFDRFDWSFADEGAGTARRIGLALAHLIWIAFAALAPLAAYAVAITRLRLLPADAASKVFFLGIPLYMAWLVFFVVGLDPLARRLVGALLDLRIGRVFWTGSFTWSVLGKEAGLGARVLVHLLDALVTATALLAPIALALLRLARKKG